MTIDQLQKKEKSTKTLIYIFVPLIIGLLFASFADYFNGEEMDIPILTIAICSIGGMVSLFPELKSIQEELKNRD